MGKNILAILLQVYYNNIMNPSLQSLLTQSMQPGGSPLNSVTAGSPNFDPGLAPPPGVPMPDKSPASMIGNLQSSYPALHTALQKQGITYGNQQNLTNFTPVIPGVNTAAQEENHITIPGNVKDLAPGKAGTQVTMTEAEKIVKVLSDRLAHKSKMEAGTSNEPLQYATPNAGGSVPGIPEPMKDMRDIYFGSQDAASMTNPGWQPTAADQIRMVQEASDPKLLESARRGRILAGS